MSVTPERLLDVVVAGAGMVGASVAYRLARAGVRVTVVDAGTPGQGTSARSFAWVNANDKPPLDYHRLNAGGVEAHRRLRDDVLAETGAAGWLNEGGGLELADDAGRQALLAKAARLQRWGYRVDVLDLADVPALEPHLLLDGIVAATYCPDEAWVDAPGCVAAVLAAARRHGAIVRADTAVEGFLRDGDRVSGVTLAGGEALIAPLVVLAAGRWTDRLAALAGVELPLTPTCGLLAVVRPVAPGISRVVHVPGMNFRPEPGGGLVLQSGVTDAGVDPETTPDPALPGCAELLARFTRYLPSLAGAQVVEARVGIRPVPSDGLTVAGAIPGRPGLYLAVTHSGVTLGPLLGELASSEISTGMPAPLLASFRPGRLVRVPAAPA